MAKKKKLKKAILVKPSEPWQEVIKQYFARQVRRNHSSLTIVKYKFVIEEYFDFCNGRVSEKSFNDYKKLLRYEGVKSITVNKYITILKTFFNWVEKQKLITINPGDNIEFLEEEERLPIVIRGEQLEKLFKDLDTDPVLRVQDGLMFELFLGTGIRTNELCHVLITDVDFEKAGLKITEGKGGKERVVAFPATALPRLKNYLTGIKNNFPMNEYLFPNRVGTKMATSTAYKRISAVLGKILHKKKGAHTLRHSFATVMLENGAPMKAIQMQLGHASMATTELYTHNTISRMKAVHEKAHPKG